MISITGAFLSSGRVRLLAVAALLAAPCLARAGDDPQKKEKLPEGVTEVSREDLASRIPNFFSFDYQFDPQPGKRLWLRVDGKHWVERYPDGMETRFRVLGRARAQGIGGTIVVRLVGDPEGDDSFQVFIPDKDDEPMRILFRVVDAGQGDWVFLGEMKKVE